MDPKAGLPTLEEMVRRLDLLPHPEGGFFRETYRSPETIAAQSLPTRFGGDRPFGTAIYFLVPAGGRSLLHRIAADEVWHFYLGGPLTIVELAPGGEVRKTRLGTNFEAGETPQHVVPAGVWFGAYNDDPDQYALVGCTVAPGFDFADFELARRDELLSAWPHDARVITRLTESS